MQQDVSAYYDQTQNHYQRWWQLDKGMSLHYGLWYKDTANFLEALNNTNHYMAELVEVKPTDKILDAGCGVGGAAIYLAKNYGAQITGISLSERQISTAQKNAKQHGVISTVDFALMDYTKTSYAAQSFDIIWACESSSSAPDKVKMLDEWHRLLKPGGRIILLDFFKESIPDLESDKMLKQWSDLWAMSPLIKASELTTLLEKQGFELRHTIDLSDKILPTIKRMYKSFILGSFPARLYNLFFRARKYSRQHYKSGLYQYKTFKQGLWRYYAIVATKK